MAASAAFVAGFIFGAICFAITFNVIHKRMLSAFMKATDEFAQSVINMFRKL